MLAGATSCSFKTDGPAGADGTDGDGNRQRDWRYAEAEGWEEAMTPKRIAASVVMGLFLWVVLMFIHEEWRVPMNAAAFGPPPFNPFTLWTPALLVAGILGLLNAFLRWADRPEEPRSAQP